MMPKKTNTKQTGVNMQPQQSKALLESLALLDVEAMSYSHEKDNKILAQFFNSTGIVLSPHCPKYYSYKERSWTKRLIENYKTLEKIQQRNESLNLKSLKAFSSNCTTSSKGSYCSCAPMHLLHSAAEDGEITLIRQILEANKNIAEWGDGNMTTALHLCAMNESATNSCQIAKLLIDNGASVNAIRKDEGQWQINDSLFYSLNTTIFYALRADNTPLSALFLNRGAIYKTFKCNVETKEITEFKRWKIYESKANTIHENIEKWLSLMQASCCPAWQIAMPMELIQKIASLHFALAFSSMS
jgi:hypothetical protein